MPIAPGTVILNGKYHVLRLIGEGGMARVWLAEELTFGNRAVAIKEPRSDLLPGERDLVLRRFDRERKVCAALAQARVPQIVHAITAEPFENSALLIMEYMPGGDLAARIKANPAGLPADQALQIMRDLCAALAGVHGHELEIVHRDIKPSNILFDAQGRGYLADFGIAQVARASVQLTEMLGFGSPHTPLYAAPEQEAGQGYLTPGADLYALGCVFFEMLTGRPYKRLPPGTLPSQLRPDLPRWLDPVVARCLAPDPWQRWQNARDLAAALDPAPGRPAPPPPQRGAPERAARAAPRPAWLVPALAGAGLLAVVALALLAVALAQGNRRGQSPAEVQITAPALAVLANARATATAAAQAVLPTSTPDQPAAASPTSAPPQAPTPAPTTAPPVAAPTEAPPASATPLPAPRLTVSQGPAYVRGGPGAAYPVLGTANQGDGLDVTGRDAAGAWWQVLYGGQPGWIAAQLVAPNAAADRVPLVRDIPPPPTTQPIYTTLSLAAAANASLTEGYVSPPLGRWQAGPVPFDLGQGQTVTTQASSLLENPQQVTIPAGIARPRAVYLLLTAGDGYVRFDQQLIGQVRLQFENGTHSVNLVLGRNIREWKQGSGVVTRTSDPDIVEVYRGAGKSDGVASIIDRLAIAVSANLQESRLVAVQVFDQTQQTLGDPDPAINIIGVTVESAP